ncbi:MAG: type II secretion system F family protein [Acidimicrobiales bacterium]
MIPVLTAGALVGLGVFLIARALRPTQPSLSMVLARVNGGTSAEPVATLEASARWAARVGPPLARALERLNIGLGDLESDLAVIGRSVEDHMALRAAGAVGGVAFAAFFGALLGLAGLAPSPLLTVWLAVAAALIGFVVPDTAARRRAVERRQAFRQSMAFFLDLVIVILAGGAGVGSALRQAAAAGDGWAYVQIRGALARGRVKREPPWVVLGRLGAELGVTELEELAASVSLAEREGASVRQSLSAKGASIRDHQLADAEAAAASATVAMSAPLVLLGIAFCGFVLYGAVSTVLIH